MKERAEHLLGYVFGLLAALVDDYTLITLAIFSVLLWLTTDDPLIAVTTFFGAYFLMRLVAHLGEAVVGSGQRVQHGNTQQAQATMQVAVALAQFHPPQEAQGVLLDPDDELMP